MSLSPWQIIGSWRLAKLRLDQAKKIEMEWRVLTAHDFFPDPVIGANNNDDYQLKLTLTESVTLEKDTEKLFAALRETAKLYPEDMPTLKLLLDTKYSLNRKAFDALSEQAKLALAAVVTIKQGAPALKLKGEE